MTKPGSGEEILLTAIREAFRALTVGQLVELATTPLGRGLVDYRLTDLLPKEAAAAAPAGAQSKEPTARARPKTATATTTTTKPKKRASKSTPDKKPTTEKESATKGRATRKESPRKKASAAKASAPPAKRRRTTATAFSAAKLDARVLEMLKVTGAQLNILELQAATGESKMRVYRSLQRLVLAGKVHSDSSKRPHTYALVAPPAV